MLCLSLVSRPLSEEGLFATMNLATHTQTSHDAMAVLIPFPEYNHLCNSSHDT